MNKFNLLVAEFITLKDKGTENGSFPYKSSLMWWANSSFIKRAFIVDLTNGRSEGRTNVRSDNRDARTHVTTDERRKKEERGEAKYFCFSSKLVFYLK